MCADRLLQFTHFLQEHFNFAWWSARVALIKLKRSARAPLNCVKIGIRCCLHEPSLSQNIQSLYIFIRHFRFFCHWITILIMYHQVLLSLIGSFTQLYRPVFMYNNCYQSDTDLILGCTKYNVCSFQLTYVVHFVQSSLKSVSRKIFF